MPFILLSTVLLFLFSACVPRYTYTPKTQSLDKAQKDTSYASFSEQEIPLPLERQKFGQSGLGFWTPLHSDEVAFLKTGHQSPKELLQLALIASGDLKTIQEIAPYIQKVESFIAKTQQNLPTFDTPQQRLKHIVIQSQKQFYPTLFASDQYYIFPQSRLSELLRTGHYNCISSTLLLGVVLNYMGYQVEGVELPTHVFLSVTMPDGNKIHIESTSEKGFNYKHTSKDYGNNDNWAEDRGLKPLTFEDYQKRTYISLRKLISQNMSNQHTSTSRMDLIDRMRLIEYRMHLYPHEPKNISAYLALINWEMNQLDKSPKDLASLFLINTNKLDSLLKNPPANSSDQKILYYIYAQKTFSTINHDLKQGLQLFEKIYPLIPSQAEYSEALLGNFASCLGKIISNLAEQNKFQQAKTLQEKYHTFILQDSYLKENFGWFYPNWINSFLAKKQYQKAIALYKKLKPNFGSEKKLLLQNVEVAYLNFAIDNYNDGYDSKAKRITKACIKELKSQKCKDLLKTL